MLKKIVNKVSQRYSKADTDLLETSSSGSAVTEVPTVEAFSNPVSLPQQKIPPSVRQWTVSSTTAHWAGLQASAFHDYAKQLDVSVEAVVLSGFWAVLYRYCAEGLSNIAVNNELTSTTMLASQTSLTGEACFADWVKETHQCLGNNSTVTAADSAQIRIAFSDGRRHTLDAREFDLSLSLICQTPDNQADGENQLELFLDFSDELYNIEDMTALLTHMQVFISNGIDQSSSPIANLKLLDAQELETLQRFNDTGLDVPTDTGMTELFAAQAAKTPDALAASFNTTRLSYRELSNQVDAVAGWLAQFSLLPDDLVAICLPRGLSLLLTQLAVQRLGAAYLPIDPEYPQERIDYIIKDANTALYLTDSSLGLSTDAFSNGRNAIPVVNVDNVLDEMLACSATLPEFLAKPDHLAYVIYTSGSTGKPKGVEITRANLVNQLYAAKQQPTITHKDIIIALTTVAFDVSIVELFLPLVCGARVHIVSREIATDGYLLRVELEKENITRMDATPSSWRMLLESGWQGNPNLVGLVGGEALPKDLISELLPKVHSLWNMYGPTETTVSCTAAAISSNYEKVTIGKPMANYQIHILDAQGQTCPLNVTGEIHISGTGTARGYLNRPELTDSSFITDAESGERLYRSGDLGRWLRDGNIECLGRIDSQVKLRGYRIELSEIENALCTINGVSHAAVVLKKNLTTEFLAAYIVANDEQSEQVTRLDKDNFSALLAATLPAYMLPSTYTLMDALPQTPNGKIDLKNLPDPERQASTSTAINPPVTRTESEVAQMWSELIGATAINRTDNFYLLGGHSLLAMRFIKMVRDAHGITVSARTLHSDTLAQLAASIRPSDKPGSKPPTVKTGKRSFTFEPVFFTSGSQQLFGVYHPAENSQATNTRHQSAILICQPIGHEHQRLQRSIRTLAENLAAAGHDVLRFDYAGTGDSSGELDNMTVATWQQNTADALQWLTKKSTRHSVAAIGIRFGALLLNSTELPNLKKCALWDPVMEGDAWTTGIEAMTTNAMRNLDRFRSVQKSKEPSELFGYYLGDKLLSDIKKLSIERDTPLAPWPLHTIIIQSLSAQQQNLPTSFSLPTIHVDEHLAWDDYRFADDMAMAGRSCRAITEWFGRPV